MRLGVITDGISRDFAHALDVMETFGLDAPEIQYVGDREVGDFGAALRREIRGQVADRGMRVSCLSRHIFAGLPMSTRPGAPEHVAHLEALRRVIGFAQELDDGAGPPLVRIMSGRKEPILFGAHGAEVWNVASGAWDALAPLIEPAVRIAAREGITLVVETGNGTMIHSAWIAAKLIEEMGAAGRLKILWDPANALWGHEAAIPDGLAALGPHLGHVHVKDVHVDTPKARLEVRALGAGDLAGALEPMAAGLRAMDYSGAISLESVHHFGDGNFEAGFRGSVDAFRRIFGAG